MNDWRTISDARYEGRAQKVCYLVVVVEQAQSGGAVVVSINAHHGLGGCRQRVLQKWFPGFILCGEGATLAAVARVILQNQDRTLAAREECFRTFC